ncbi:3-deoxy-manno-octulosonate cytidylyltransferase [Candidatus Symbiothrix dinenymphae]|uniref:3-deoxy-manno-octulosonate cytidylyltransferase n=1 Tax=Candidatus Symbiothrix dinenymphae TaxID=467085 RepID=UPI0006C09238|nr:3-deoxy-manno-octulosonate cytidylyltransferase [Candidatus Symbiothrix dinenymphae]GAP72752.1 3-deoxy-D-manno-octulosonate cytidylyltransferase [Candidatus Symbiothrix dinenymphae]
MRIIGVIPARYNSSRFEGKPLADICGKPMIWWVYQQAKKVAEFSAVFVATDDERIEKACQQYGLEVVMTSSNHKTGTDRVAEVARKVEGDLFVNVQGDEPLIDPRMIQQVIEIFKDKSVYFGTLKKELTEQSAIEDVNAVKIVTDLKGDALYMSRSVVPSNVRGKARVFKHIGIYAYKRDFLMLYPTLPQTELEIGESLEQLRALEHGYKLRAHETEFETIGVDLPEHIAQVEHVLKSFGK